MTRPSTYLLAGALALAAAAVADDTLSPTDERVRLSLGIERNSATTTLRVDPNNGTLGSVIDGENQLGLDRFRYAPKFQAVVRVEERNRLRFDYFSLDRSDKKTLGAAAAPVKFGASTLNPNDPVQTDLSLRGLGITYGYSFLHRQNFELAGTIGIDIIDISARARVQTATHHVDQREDVAGPYPLVGLDGTWVLSRHFYLDARAQYLKVSVDQLDGSLGVYEFAALYRYRPNVAFALGYNVLKAHLASTKTHQGGQFDFDAKGPELFVRVAF